MLRILIVDDCPDSATTLQLLLRSWGHETHVATDGPTALELADIHQPDVVILDLGKPGMNGYAVANHLRRLRQRKPILIAHSGSCRSEDVRRSLEAGCLAHLTKPVHPEEIRRTLGICRKWLHWNPWV